MGTEDHPPAWALPGTLLFVAFVPGTVILLVPYLMTGWEMAPPLLGTALTRWLGAALVLVAAPLFVQFASRFVWEGHGTPAPVAPPEHLVVGGAFRYTRNPGYVAVVGLVLGQALWFGNMGVAIYATCLWLGFHLFVLLYEEPTLQQTFGAEYDAYCRRVPRWIPRLGRSG